MRRTAACALLFCGALLLPGPAAAHRLAPSLLSLRETGGGEVRVLWRTPLLQPSGARLEPALPEHCETRGEPTASVDGGGASLAFVLDCGGRGLVGTEVGVRGLAESGTGALVRVELADGRVLQGVLAGGRDRFPVPARERPAQVAASYLSLGTGHILGGLDHLLFVLGLVLLVRGRRALLAAVTAFTAGHSVTLSLAALGVVRFPTAWIELAIAGSVFALAVELAGGTPDGGAPAGGHGRGRPWAWAFAFGLLHGLGFAGALAEIGLPAGEIPWALASFNAGIELGQLAFVAAVLLVRRALAAPLATAPGWVARVPVYGIGSLAAYFCLERAAALL